MVGIGGMEIQAEDVGDIRVMVKTPSGYEASTLTQVLYVPNLGRSLFSCYRAAQKGVYTLHMKNGCSLICDGNVVMTGVMRNKMYELEIEVLLPPPEQANVARSFGVER
jgi:hypothetical protein